MSQIVALESVIDRNVKEAVLTANETLKRKLTVSETRKIVEKRARELRLEHEEKEDFTFSDHVKFILCLTRACK